MSSCYLNVIFLFSVEWQRNGDYGGLNYGCIWILILFSHVSHPSRSLFFLTLLQSSTYYAITFIFLLHLNDRMPRYQFFNRIIHIFSLGFILVKKVLPIRDIDLVTVCSGAQSARTYMQDMKTEFIVLYRLSFLLLSSPPLHNNPFYAYVWDHNYY